MWNELNTDTYRNSVCRQSSNERTKCVLGFPRQVGLFVGGRSLMGWGRGGRLRGNNDDNGRTPGRHSVRRVVEARSSILPKAASGFVIRKLSVGQQQGMSKAARQQGPTHRQLELITQRTSLAEQLEPICGGL